MHGIEDICQVKTFINISAKCRLEGGGVGGGGFVGAWTPALFSDM